jgi:hypothetical protein
MLFLEIIFARDEVGMVVSAEDTHKFFPPGLDEFIILSSVEEGVDQETLVSRLNIVAVDGQTSSQHLLHVESRSFVTGFDRVLVVERMGRHPVLHPIGQGGSLPWVDGIDGFGHAHGGTGPQSETCTSNEFKAVNQALHQIESFISGNLTQI